MSSVGESNDGYEGYFRHSSTEIDGGGDDGGIELQEEDDGYNSAETGSVYIEGDATVSRGPTDDYDVSVVDEAKNAALGRMAPFAPNVPDEPKSTNPGDDEVIQVDPKQKSVNTEPKTAPSRPTNRNKKRRFIILAFLLLLVVGIVLAVLFPTVILKDDDDTNSSAAAKAQFNDTGTGGDGVNGDGINGTMNETIQDDGNALDGDDNVTIVDGNVTANDTNDDAVDDIVIDDENTGGTNDTTGETNDTIAIGNETEAIVEYIKDGLSSQGISLQNDLSLVGSPQDQAVRWIAEVDGLPASISNPEFIERYSLVLLYYALGGTEWKHQLGFLQPGHVCGWFQHFTDSNNRVRQLGVLGCVSSNSNGAEQTRNMESGLVFGISIDINDVNGVIPSEIRYFSQMEYLRMPFNNNLSGPIPDEIQELTKLIFVDFRYCSLSGGIPAWIGKLSKLRFLGLSNNVLDGPLPSSLAQADLLEEIFLDDNMLSGDISVFSDLTNVALLALEDNEFVGPLTDALLDGWPFLVVIDLSGNPIGSSLPEKIFEHPSLRIIDLHNTMLTGDVPGVPVVNNELTVLSLFNNSLNSLPMEISNLQGLQNLDVSFNAITSIPDLGGLANLRSLYTGPNPLDPGPLPSFLRNIPGLEELSMKGNGITGQIPPWISDLPNLRLLDLDSNSLVGSIPTEIGLLFGLEFLLLNRNQLFGEVPEELSNLANLYLILLENNDLTGIVGSLCEDAKNLQFFSSDCLFEVWCPCCNICCSDDIPCNNFLWSSNYDPMWEFNFVRRSYSFDINS